MAELKEAVQKTVRNEEWKYTNLFSVISPALQKTETDADAAIPVPTGNRILIVNGQVAMLCNNSTVVKEIRSIEPVQGTATESPFLDLNRSVAAYTVEVSVPAGVRRDQPVVVDVVSDGSSASLLSAVRLRFRTEAGADLVVFENHHGAGDHQALNITVTELDVHEESRLEYVKRTQLPANLKHIGSTIACVQRNGKLHTHALCLGGPYVRNDLYVRLEGKGAEVHLNGLSDLRQNDTADNHTVVDHIVPDCYSNELYKGIYRDASVGIFNGKIFVRKGAQKTIAYQSNRSLLLGERAQVNAKPQLEIWADDVKCSHGATTGQLDAEALFYLRSRGLSTEKATALLVDAFANEVLNRLPKQTVLQ